MISTSSYLVDEALLFTHLRYELGSCVFLAALTFIFLELRKCAKLTEIKFHEQ